MEVTIVGRQQLKDRYLNNLQEDTAYIVILEPDDCEPLAEEQRNYKEFVFYDLEEDMDNGAGFIYKAISEEQAKDMYNFIKSNANKKHFVVSCAAGISRSGAVGSFVYEYFGGKYKDLLKKHPYILPNGRCVKLLRMYERIDYMGDDIKIQF